MEVGKVNRYTSIKKERLDTQENIKSSNMKSFINLRFLPLVKLNYLFFLFFLFWIASYSQLKDDYRRSSLSITLLELEDFPNRDIILNSYNEYPFPDKYDNHSLKGFESFDPKTIELSEMEMKSVYDTLKLGSDDIQKIKEWQKTPKSELINTQIYAIETLENWINYTKHYKFFQKNEIGKKIIQKWIQYNPEDGKMNTDLIVKRGLYNANFDDFQLSDVSALGKSSIIDNSFYDLLNSSYSVLIQLRFRDNEKYAKIIYDSAIEAAKQIESPLAQGIAINIAETIYNKSKEGYSVLAFAYLYKLDWNKQVQNDLFKMWGNKEMFENYKGFKMKFIGAEKSSTLVTFSFKKEDRGRTKEDVLKRSVVRSIDKVFVELQKDYDFFKPMFKVETTNPFSSYIGMKEGLKGGEKFKVLSYEINKDGKIVTKTIGKIKVDKSKVFDNRYSLDNMKNIGKTYFKGKVKGSYPGMYIKQIK